MADHHFYRTSCTNIFLIEYFILLYNFCFTFILGQSTRHQFDCQKTDRRPSLTRRRVQFSQSDRCVVP